MRERARILAGIGTRALELEGEGRPLVLLHGYHDQLVPPSGARRLLDAVPGARLELLAGAGHCAQLEQPARVAALAMDFVDRLTHTVSPVCFRAPEW